MAQKPTPGQTLLLWNLVALGGSSYQSKLGRKVDSKDRNALKANGLVVADRHGNSGVWLEVTDKGWAWAGQNLGAPLPAKAQAGAVLQAWLSRLQKYMEANKVTLAELIAPAEREQLPYDKMRDRIRVAYRALAGGSFNKRVLLRDLRDKLSDVDRVALDNAILRMMREDGASLVELDNRREITHADRSAAIQIGGEPRHILWISR